jgi:aminoglycoside phosphotransferase (APT) family kinase protein
VTTPAASPMRRSSRDPEVLRVRLETWLATKVGTPRVDNLSGTDANGMSSDTVLFDAHWTDDDGTSYDEHLVARLAPDLADVPVFPWYDMTAQFQTIKGVHELTDVPIPEPRWCETDLDVIGAEFFVMNRVDGLVPPDVMPYPFGDNWLFNAGAGDQRRLQESTVEAIAQLHAIPEAPKQFPWLERSEAGTTHLRRHVAHTRAWYDRVAADGGTSPLVERAFAWLDAHWPDDDDDVVLSWGDSRIGNVIYQDFAPVALLDWEMAGLGPRELDVSWLICGHLVFQDIAEALGLPGMPSFLRPEDVAAQYAALTGYNVRDLDFYLAYAAIQWAIVFLRTGQRQAHFGEREIPADVHEMILSRPLLERLISH